jgi:hypothetical protein
MRRRHELEEASRLRRVVPLLVAFLLVAFWYLVGVLD